MIGIKRKPCLGWEISIIEIKQIIDICFLNSKAVPLHAMEALGGKRRYSFYSITTSALDGGEWSASRPAALYPRGKDPRYPLYRRLGGPQIRSGHRGYRQNPLPLPGIEPLSPGRPARSHILYCLSYPGTSFINSNNIKT
jgi:hypothetical protein